VIDTILFDLDGTLLAVKQADFLGVYLVELGKVFARMGLDPDKALKAMWAGTKAMVENDGGALNSFRFWQTFQGYLGLSTDERLPIEAACDGFYNDEFHRVKSVARLDGAAARLVRDTSAKGYKVVLATNPLFPLVAVRARLGWLGLSDADFFLVTHYANCTYSKPNPGYYKDILSKISKEPGQCLMAGNSPAEDMCAGELGIETFLVTDCLENETGTAISRFRNGSLRDLETLLSAFPDLTAQQM